MAQGAALGALYGPVHAVSLGIGGLIGVVTGAGFSGGTHKYNIFERWAISVPNW